MLAVTIILGLLLHYKGQPLSDWKSKVQITAVVAVFFQVAQPALIVSVAFCIGQSKWSLIRSKKLTIELQRHDEASRGPEGALKLLFMSLWGPKTREPPSAQS